MDAGERNAAHRAQCARLVARLGADAYGAEIRRELLGRTGRDYVVGAVYATLTRLEDKRLLRSTMSDPTPVRGGRSRRLYELTNAGVEAVRRAESARASLARGVNLRLKRT